MSIYMKIDGIDGHVTAKGYEKWIELDNVHFGVERTISAKPGNTADREATKPTIREVVVAKTMDKTTPNIFTEACVGKAKSKVEIHICQTGEKISPYMQYEFDNVIFSNYQVSALGTEQNVIPKEILHLNFDKIQMKYTPYNDKHQAGSPIPAGYDLSSATKI